MYVTKDCRTVYSMCARDAEMMKSMCSFHASAGDFFDEWSAWWAFRIMRCARDR